MEFAAWNINLGCPENDNANYEDGFSDCEGDTLDVPSASPPEVIADAEAFIEKDFRTLIPGYSDGTSDVEQNAVLPGCTPLQHLMLVGCLRLLSRQL